MSVLQTDSSRIWGCEKAIRLREWCPQGWVSAHLRKWQTIGLLFFVQCENIRIQVSEPRRACSPKPNMLTTGKQASGWQIMIFRTLRTEDLVFIRYIVYSDLISKLLYSEADTHPVLIFLLCCYSRATESRSHAVSYLYLSLDK